MQDPIRHVVVDANVLSSALLPQSTENQQLRQRAGMLVRAAVEARWPSLVLYTPGICVAEVLGTFDKYRYCTWHGVLRSSPERQITHDDYCSAQEGLKEALRSERFHRIEHDPKDALAAGLVSPINAFFEDCGRAWGERGRHQPMSATDCVIAGVAILLHRQQGRDRVVLATADQRLSDVMQKAKTLTEDEEGMLGLEFPASDIGLDDGWSPDVYPECVNLIHAEDADLRGAFLGWPLPDAPLTERTASDLTPTERDSLARVWLEVKREYDLGGEDSLPYTPALDDLRTRSPAHPVITCRTIKSTERCRTCAKLVSSQQTRTKTGLLVPKTPRFLTDSSDRAPGQ